MAMIAWSAKVFASATCCSVKAPVLARRIAIARRIKSFLFGSNVEAPVAASHSNVDIDTLATMVRSIIESGYDNAMSAIVDSNITTLISGIVLYQFGTGPIKGFATTLSIGILTTMFTAIVVTRLMYDYFVYGKKIQKVSI